MQITRVALTNIKNHAEAEWAFYPGVTAICGPNGSGKTTIIESIAWALFDHLEYKREDFVKRGKKKGTVVVDFISALDGRAYVVQRDTSGVYYVYDPKTKTRVVEQKNQVRPWLCRHIGVDEDADLSTLFKSTIGVPQGAFTFDFSRSPADRKNVFDRILKVDEYRAASDNLRDTNKHIRNQIGEADRGVAEAEGELKVYDRTRSEVDNLTAQVAALVSESESTERACKRLSEETATLDARKTLIEEKRGVLERLAVKLNVARDRLSVAREAAETARTAATLVAAARAGYDRYLAASHRLDELETARRAREALRNQLAGIDGERIQTESDIRLFEQRLNEITEARAALDILAPKIEEQQCIESQIAALRESRGERLSIERAIGKLDEELERLRKHYSQTSLKLETAEKHRESAEKAQELEDERTALDRKLQECELAEKGRQMKQADLDRQRGELSRLEHEAAQKQAEIDKLEDLAETAAEASLLSEQYRQDSERLAKLRAETARDAEMITALEGGGICPLLSEKCLNLKPGESLDSRFRTGLAQRREEISQIEIALPLLANRRNASERAAMGIARLPEIKRQLEQLQETLAERRRQIGELEKETGPDSAKLAEEIRGFKQQRADLDSRLKTAREAQKVYAQAEGLKQTLYALKVEGGEKKNIRDAESARLDAFGELDARLKEAEQALAALEDPRGRAAALRTQIEREAEWRRELEKNRRRSVDIATRRQSVNEALQDYSALDAELATATAERAANEPDYRTCIANEQSASTVDAREREAAESEGEVAQLDAERAAVDAELKVLIADFDGGRHERAHRELDAARHQATQLAAMLQNARAQLQKAEQQLEYLEKVRARMRAHMVTRDRFTRIGETTEFVRDILQKAAPYLIDSYVFSISIEANQLFRDITGRHESMLRWTRDYEITLEEEGHSRPFANLSGGEQMAAALAVRLALLKELSELKLAFFDEPTTNMDEERRRNLAQQIGRIKDFQQLFVISHDDSFEGFTDQIITLGER